LTRPRRHPTPPPAPNARKSPPQPPATPVWPRSVPIAPKATGSAAEDERIWHTVCAGVGSRTRLNRAAASSFPEGRYRHQQHYPSEYDQGRQFFQGRLAGRPARFTAWLVGVTLVDAVHGDAGAGAER